MSLKTKDLIQYVARKWWDSNGTVNPDPDDLEPIIQRFFVDFELRMPAHNVIKSVANQINEHVMRELVNIQHEELMIQQREEHAFEEAVTRAAEPEVKVFIHPLIADLQMIETERQPYGPYTYKIKSPENLTIVELENFKKRALYQAVQISDADVLIEPLFDSYIDESDPHKLVINLTGFPAKYVNFRNLGSSPDDLEMVRVVYPAAYSPSYVRSINTRDETTQAVDSK